jgi:hypothetical protein
MRKRKPTLLTLDPQAVQVLETVPKGGRSEYVSELIIDDGHEKGVLGPDLDQAPDDEKSAEKSPEESGA